MDATLQARLTMDHMRLEVEATTMENMRSVLNELTRERDEAVRGRDSLFQELQDTKRALLAREEGDEAAVLQLTVNKV